MKKKPAQTFRFLSSYPCSPEQLYDWHSREGALERLLPPWEKTEIQRKEGGIAPGARVALKMRVGPFGLVSLPFTARHLLAERGRMFQDTQERGPFACWIHSHFFHEEKEGCQLEDQVEYALPLHRLLPGFVHRHVERELQRMFQYRTETLREDILLHSRCSGKPMRLLISGASGVVGKELLPLLLTGGHEVWRLVRRAVRPGSREIFWNPQAGELDLSSAPPFTGVVHLAGEYIGLHRWTEEKRKKVLQSRIEGTSLLIERLAALEKEKRPAVFLCASATGYYGDCQKRHLREDQEAGAGFISEVCKRWEETAAQAEAVGIRTAMLRFGVGLTPRGGALARILGLSACGYIRFFGSGQQMISWISSDDMVAAILHCLSHEVHGPVNVVAPEPVSNQEFMRQLARLTGRPLLLPLPAWLLHLVYGEMAREMPLASTHVSCEKLVESGFRFRHPDLETALRAMLGRSTTADRASSF